MAIPGYFKMHIAWIIYLLFLICRYPFIPVSYTHLRLVCLPVKRPYAITLYGRLPIVLRAPLEATVTLLEATTPVKLPTKQCPRIYELELK